MHFVLAKPAITNFENVVKMKIKDKDIDER